MNKQVLKQIKNVQVGDLMRVEWFDASTGKTAMAGPIDTPVKSWGVYLGVFGEKNKHIILAQNEFRMTDQRPIRRRLRSYSPKLDHKHPHYSLTRTWTKRARDKQLRRQKL